VARSAFLTAAVSVTLALGAASAAEAPALPPAAHVDQATVAQLPLKTVFERGDRIFNTRYNSVDGVGANLSADPAVSVRFSRVPRADLPGFAAHPFRASGPVAQSCRDCHNSPFEAGAGLLEANALRDARRTGIPAEFINRNPIHLFGSGALQRLAEEATADLFRLRDWAIERASATHAEVSVPLTTANGVNYGTLRVTPQGTLDTSGVRGVDPDLIIKPYLWKGELASFLRAFTRGSAELELGMQPLELVGPGVDADFDGVVNELTPGDITAMSIYVAAQARPVTKLELSRVLGGRYRLSAEQTRDIRAGEKLFMTTGCGGCHRPALVAKETMFREPSASAQYRDAALPNGAPTTAIGLDPAHPTQFDLTENTAIGRRADGRCAVLQPISVPFVKWGRGRHAPLCFPQFESTDDGGMVVRLYGDLKRHDMGPALAEPVDEIGSGKSMWKTRDLWGVGSTGPWLHDGRATTLTEAILLHGGEGQPARDRFAELPPAHQDALLAFLDNLVLFHPQD
jgi:mono/diheme cytochrome c family protein